MQVQSVRVLDTVAFVYLFLELFGSVYSDGFSDVTAAAREELDPPLLALKYFRDFGRQTSLLLLHGQHHFLCTLSD